jgi:hypothetical protein
MNYFGKDDPWAQEQEQEQAKPAPPAAPAVPVKIDPATREIWDYLMEVMGDYETFLQNIGTLGYSAPQLLYYRDEVQEFLEELSGRTDINLAGAWKKVVELDTILRAKAQVLVDEIGHKNFVQYQIQNDPPRAHWWWWLNRVTAAPPAPPKIWEFWKFQANQNPAAQEAESAPAAPQREVDPRVAKLFERDANKP